MSHQEVVIYTNLWDSVCHVAKKVVRWAWEDRQPRLETLLWICLCEKLNLLWINTLGEKSKEFVIAPITGWWGANLVMGNPRRKNWIFVRKRLQTHIHLPPLPPLRGQGQGSWMTCLIYFIFSDMQEFGFPRDSCPTVLFVAVIYSLSHVWTFCSSMEYSPPGSSVHGISQARILEWVAISFFKGSSWPRDRTRVSCLTNWLFTTEPPGKAVPVSEQILLEAGMVGPGTGLLNSLFHLAPLPPVTAGLSHWLTWWAPHISLGWWKLPHQAVAWEVKPPLPRDGVSARLCTFPLGNIWPFSLEFFH